MYLGLKFGDDPGINSSELKMSVALSEQKTTS
jgi:hypothetical protein